MRKLLRKKWGVLLLSGSVLLQTSGCLETAALITSTSSLATAGGVFYLIFRVLQD